MKTKVAFLLAYNGKSYHGSQFNNKLPTIEHALIESLLAIQAIKPQNSTDPRKINLNRTSRTDKGVHAALAVITCKIENDLFTNIQKQDLLRDDLRSKNVWLYKIVRVARGFVPKNRCDSRIYEYVLPSFVLRKNENSIDELKIDENLEDCVKKEEENNNAVKMGTNIILTEIDNVLVEKEETKMETENYHLKKENITPADKLQNNNVSTNIEKPTKHYEILKISEIEYNYRISETDYDLLTTMLQKFVGTQNFHNFTTASNETGTKRYIKNIIAKEKLVRNNIEYIKVQIQGSSFMLHQIRKMMGFVASVFQFNKNKYAELFDKAFSDVKINIPKAPSEFLFLDMPVFEYYNEKAEHGKIEVEDVERQRIKDQFIYPEIFLEGNLSSFMNWCEVFKKHTYEFDYLN